MKYYRNNPKMEACNKINGEACEKRMEDYMFIGELIGKLDKIDKYVMEDILLYIYKRIQSEEYMMHRYGVKSKREIAKEKALEVKIRKELENEKK